MIFAVIGFKIKRGFESFTDFFKDLFSNTRDFFVRINRNSKTEQAKVKIVHIKERLLENLKINKDNWKSRTFEDHGFQIGDEDT